MISTKGLAIALLGAVLFLTDLSNEAQAQLAAQDDLIPRFERPESGLVLERSTQKGTFFDVLGRRAALFGYENETFEVWTYPLKILDSFRLTFEIEGYPVPVEGTDAMARIEVRPEATTLVYTHAAFTIRQTIFAPIEEPGLVMLLDVDSALPLQIHASFRPDLRLMWPAGLMTGNLIWDADDSRYTILEETNRFVGMIGAPGAQDVSVQPYQEEPKDLPTRFLLDIPVEIAEDHFIPIVVAGSVDGQEEAEATYDRLLAEAPELYRETVDFYEELVEGSMRIETPDERLNRAFDWAKVGIDKGLATNPMLGTGFLAGFRTSGNSERPGFAWFFGRDALWTALATTAYGNYESTRTALDFLKQFQREDGRIPHEISQSATLVNWFEDYPYPWASADATPLYVIVHADLWSATGDNDYLRENWESIKAAYQFTKETDTDGNGLIENTDVGHGWVEGGELYPPHEELYMQGLWIEACRNIAELAEAMREEALAEEAQEEAERTRRATEETYWLEEEGFYAFATRPDTSDEALFRENTALQGVPLWWRTLDAERAHEAIDHFGSGVLATDWGARILSKRSALYDPLSYHNGSVWPLFTGWTSMGAYRYDRPHVGYQALMATVLLTEQDALGYVTELLSGDYNTAFGRTSHHQVWSEAMVITPLVQGLLGLEVHDGGETIRFAPQLPADWDSLRVENATVGGGRYDLSLERGEGRLQINVTNLSGEAMQWEMAPAFPLDATVQSVMVDGNEVDFETSRAGNLQRAAVQLEPTSEAEIVYRYDEGTEVYMRHEEPAAGARSQGLRILRSRPAYGMLHLVLKGLGGRTYSLSVRTPYRVEATEGVRIERSEAGDTVLHVSFDGPSGEYQQRSLQLPLQER